ncbi:MAG: glycosyltransferase family 2 protein [Solobacterium sp.]|nr:glycosyltransferase family 2 protein [Solobacterium sp.]
MINVVIPMAGRGSRFVRQGYTIPKPLIDVLGTPMIELVSDNVRPAGEHRFVYLCLQDHIEKYNLRRELERISPGCVIVPVDHVTEGAACTVLLAKEYINNDDALMIANSDQYVDTSIDAYISAIEKDDGLIMTMTADEDKWSYIAFDDDRHVTMVREKEVISNEATVGIYNFAHGRDYVHYAEEMIARDMRSKGEFYVAPVYNLMIEDGKKIGFYNIGSEGNGMYGLGIPEDLQAFLEGDMAERIRQERSR